MTKRTDKKHPGFGGTAGGAAIALDGGYKEGAREQAAAAMASLAPPAPTKRPRNSDVMLVARIDPDKGIRAIIPIKATMRGLRAAVGSQHISQRMVTSHNSIEVDVICHHLPDKALKVWKIKGSFPVRGRALLIGVVNKLPVNFPADVEWLKRMVDLDVGEDIIPLNDLKPKKG